MSRSKNKSALSALKLPILVSLVYTFVMGLGWVINPHPYGDIKNVIFMTPILLALSIYAIILVKKSKIPLTSKKLSKSLILWIFVGLIVYLMISNVLVFSEGGQSGPWQKIALLLLATLLVGLAEEGVYRGYILNTIEKKIGVKKALFYSSILFGLMHSVNFLAGPSIAQTVVQVLLTTAIGYVFGVIYLSTKRDLLLIMFLHGIYDFLVFNFSYLTEVNKSNQTTGLILPFLIIIWLIAVTYSKKSLFNHSK